ncbi:hypothetical protein INS49_010729 [Diaporthe citri]|uniref:uncharacterized protein n=1 Tax=Diaporthe citri TaxID=83186 RepID=UPI001C825909|nr:uncharacterized protein INS49_010729 [Diaporthe citri]KAG6362497.1 hypothetical protein INS49_010729 [Diaporthe citri]
MPSKKRSQAHDAEGRETQQRSRKRERYTRIACESCKTRKVKCSGSLPCSRRANAAPRKDCTAADLSSATQQDLGQLLASMRKICDDIQSSTKRFGSPSSQFRSSPRRRRSETAGANPASNSDPIAFVDSLDQARRILEQRGIISSLPCLTRTLPPLEAARPVLELGHENALAHLAAFRDHLFPLYPCIDLTLAKENIDSLFRTSLLSFAGGVQDLGVHLIDIEATKAVLAIGMLIEGNADSPLSSSLETHLIWNADSIIRRDHAQIEDVIMGALLTIYFMLRQEARKAWRSAGLVVQSAFEVGLHKERYYRHGNATIERSCFLKRLMACVVDLDKRCSFMVNLPYHLHDTEIDDSVLDLHGRYPLLSAMVNLNIIQAELFELISTAKAGSGGYKSKEINDRMDYLDHRIQKLAEETSRVDLFPPDSLVVPPPAERVVLESFPDAHNISEDAGAFQIPQLLAYGPICRSAFHAAIDFLIASPYTGSGSKPRLWCSLDEMRRLGETIQMPTPDKPTPPNAVSTDASSESTAVELLDIHPQGVEDDIFGTFDATEDNYMAILGMVTTQLDYLSNPT